MVAVGGSGCLGSVTFIGRSLRGFKCRYQGFWVGLVGPEDFAQSPSPVVRYVTLLRLQKIDNEYSRTQGHICTRTALARIFASLLERVVQLLTSLPTDCCGACQEGDMIIEICLREEG